MAAAALFAVFEPSSLKNELSIPHQFVWPRADVRPAAANPLDTPIIDIAGIHSGGSAKAVAAAKVGAACARFGIFQVTGHGVSEKLMRAAVEDMGEFFKMPLDRKMRARRRVGSVAGYAAAHADRFTTQLPWKETLSFGDRGDGELRTPSPVADYFTNTFGPDLAKLGVVYQGYCEEVRRVAMWIMELLAMSMGLAGSSYDDLFEDANCIMRLNLYPPCPEPERTAGTGPHCDPAALTILQQQDDVVDGLQVLVDGEWRAVPPVAGALVVILGDTFMALCNGRYSSCVHRAVVNRHRERRSLAFFVCPRADCVLRPPPTTRGADIIGRRRLYPDFTWAEFMRFTQSYRRADSGGLRTLDAFVQRRK